MERRKFTRITVDVPATLSILQVEAYHTGALANISEGGCFFPVSGDIPLGEACNICISIGEGLQAETILFEGTVVRSDAKGIGIKFNGPENRYRTTVKKIVDYYEETA